MDNKIALCPKCHGKLTKNGMHNGSQEYRCRNMNCSEKYVYHPVWTEYNNGSTTLLVDKKQGSFDFREWTKLIKNKQNLHAKAGKAQPSSHPIIKTKLKNIIVLYLSDLHLGALGTDYDMFLQFTDFLLQDNVYGVLVGDLSDNFVNFKNMLAMHQQVISPREQDMFVEAWIKEVKHKILGAFWGNHEEMEEKHTGKNNIKDILSTHIPYMNGIGQVEVSLNQQIYKIAATHKTRYFSSLNSLHGLKRLAQMDLPNEDIYIAGDRHVPGLEIAFQRGRVSTYIQLGTLKVEDAYSKRYFSNATSSAMPCTILNTEKHLITPFWSIDQAVEYCNALEQKGKYA